MLRQEAFKKTIGLFFVLAMAFLFLGMAPKPFEGKQTSDQPVSAALFALSSVYASEELISFVNLLDQDFEGLGDFRDALQQEFFSKKNLELRFIIDSVLEEKDRILVRLHWLKRFVQPSGAIFKEKGKSQFLFHRTPEGLKLLYIRGDNPFF